MPSAESKIFFISVLHFSLQFLFFACIRFAKLFGCWYFFIICFVWFFFSFHLLLLLLHRLVLSLKPILASLLSSFIRYALQCSVLDDFTVSTSCTPLRIRLIWMDHILWCWQKEYYYFKFSVRFKIPNSNEGNCVIVNRNTKRENPIDAIFF